MNEIFASRNIVVKMLKHKVKEEILKVVGELITHLKVDPTKIICLFLIRNNGSHEKVG